MADGQLDEFKALLSEVPSDQHAVLLRQRNEAHNVSPSSTAATYYTHSLGLLTGPDTAAQGSWEGAGGNCQLPHRARGRHRDEE